MPDSRSSPVLPVIDPPPRRLPSWLRREIPRADAGHFTRGLLEELNLVTVCDEAKCPNRMECYSRKTATFMILGETCTRACSFCSVDRGTPAPPASDEPARVAEAARRLGLRHVVITSVTRDDMADGGAEHFVRCIEAVRAELPDAAIEVLTPDFLGKPDSIKPIVAARPDVFNHNTETVPRLYRKVRGPQSQYNWTLELLRRVKSIDGSVRTKSGLMLGLGETYDELFDVFADLRSVGCDFLTLGQYLQPDTKRYLTPVRYLTPEEFHWLGERAEAMGFAQVASGPFVRSSYHARELLGQERSEPSAC